MRRLSQHRPCCANTNIWLSPSAALKRAIAELDAPRQRARRHIALNRGEFKRQRGNGMRQTGQRLSLETFDVDLGERRRAMPFDQRVERRHRHRHRFRPVFRLANAGEAAAAETKSSEAVEIVGLATLSLQRHRPRLAADRDRFDDDIAVAAIEQPQHRRQRRLRLDRNDAAPSRRNARTRSPTCAPTSNTRSPGLTNLRIEPLASPRRARGRRNKSAASGSRRARCAAGQAWPRIASAGTSSARRISGGDSSSGRLQRPRRHQQAPDARRSP